MVISECHVNWDSNILLFWGVCGLLSGMVRLNTYLYETGRITAAFIIQGCDPWKKKERGLNIWNILQTILNNILLYSLLRALVVQRGRCCLCMWVTPSDNLGALWSGLCSAPVWFTRRKELARLPQGLPTASPISQSITRKGWSGKHKRIAHKTTKDICKVCFFLQNRSGSQYFRDLMWQNHNKTPLGWQLS